jgi:hypothetical protein
MSYVTLPQFKDAISIADTVDDASLQRALDAATEWIDRYCGRTFGAVDTSLATRVFDPYQADRLAVPDLTSVSAVEVDTDHDGTFSELLEADEYALYPLNAMQPGSLPGGYTEIRLTTHASLAFIQGELVRVTAHWGFGTTPAAVEQACILLANRYFHRPNAPFGQWEGPQTGMLGTVPEQDPDVIALLSGYTTAAAAGSGVSDWVLV